MLYISLHSNHYSTLMFILDKLQLKYLHWARIEYEIINWQTQSQSLHTESNNIDQSYS